MSASIDIPVSAALIEQRKRDRDEWLITTVDAYMSAPFARAIHTNAKVAQCNTRHPANEQLECSLPAGHLSPDETGYHESMGGTRIVARWKGTGV